LAEHSIPPLSTEPKPPPIQPSKRRIDTKTAAIILSVVVLVSILSGLAYAYVDLNNRFNKLRSDYNTLKTDYSTLQARHAQFTTSYQTLSHNYTLLKNQYTTLSQDYNELSQAFNNPLSYKTTPTITELEQWLTSDNTDSIHFTIPDFICGDFSVMLSQHAKLKHWDIGIVVARGYTETYQSYNHAFNAIITTEGLVYIEPQNDHYWWYSGHQPISEDSWWEIDDEQIYVQGYTIVVLYS